MNWQMFAATEFRFHLPCHLKIFGSISGSSILGPGYSMLDPEYSGFSVLDVGCSILDA